MTFRKDGGHPVLMLRPGGFPTLLDNSYLFSTTENLERVSNFKITPRDLAVGDYIIGVFNMNYYVNSDCEYELVVSPGDDDSYLMARGGVENKHSTDVGVYLEEALDRRCVDKPSPRLCMKYCIHPVGKSRGLV